MPKPYMVGHFFGSVLVGGFSDIQVARLGFWVCMRRNGHVKWLFMDEWSEAEFNKFRCESEIEAQQWRNTA